MKITIVGSGKKVAFLADSLLGEHHSLTVINEYKNECVELSRAFENITVINGDGSKPFILREASVGNSELMIAITNTDADNFVICQLAKKMFNIKRAFATVNDPSNVYVFRKLGINTAVSATRIMSEIIGQMASINDIVKYLPMEDGKLQLMEFNIMRSSHLCDKKIVDIKLPHNCIIGCMMHEGKLIIPNGHTKISAGDKLTILALSEAKKRIVEIFSGGDTSGH